MNLIDLKKDPQPNNREEMYEEPMYSYGLCISLGEEELTKLGIEKLPEAGSDMMIKAIAYVKTVSERKEKEGVSQHVELQICAMGIEPFDKTGDQAEGLYAKKDTPAPKAEPAAKTATYLAQELIMGLKQKMEKKNAALIKTKAETGDYQLTEKERKLLKKYYPNSNMN